ncbi:MAG: hypothetical protein UW94_C0004G0022 [Parcubacteria group bacterium GW2011_GWA2_45_14]|nr:MAG: hypothetical protein UW94_C0004G0022 [Parcubacteria group bacterium GW2011_GWA2_45_14]
MVSPNELFEPPSELEVAEANQLQHREFAMFSALLYILSDADSRKRLTCLPQLTPRQPSHSNRFRISFLRCFRLLSLSERKYVKSFFLGSLRQAYYASLAPKSYLLQSWLDKEEIDHDQDFLSWCAGQHCRRLSAADMFLVLVQLECCVLRENFMPVWSGFTISSAGKLRAMMWRIIQCGASTINPFTSAGEVRYLVRTTHFSCEI